MCNLVCEPTAPRLAQSIRVPTGAYDVAVAGDLVDMAAREGGLLVFHGPAPPTRPVRR